MSVQLKGNDTQSGDLRQASLGLNRQDGGVLNVGGGGGGNSVAPPRDDSSNSDGREAGGGSSLSFLPSKSTNSGTDFIGFSVSKRDKGFTPAKARLNAGSDENGNNSEFKEETSKIDDFVPDMEPDGNPLNEDPVYVDSYGVGGNDTAYGGGGGGIGYRDVSGYDTPYDMQGIDVSKTASKKKKMYIFLIIAFAVVVMVFLSHKKSKKRR